MPLKDMDFNQFSCDLITKINNMPEHPLNQFVAYNYYTDFFTTIKQILETNTFLKAKSSILLNKLQLNNNFDQMKYLQFISELIFIKYAISKNLIFSIDKKLQIADGKNTDVDLQIQTQDIDINIEIKCPHFEKNTTFERVLNINTGFRTINKELLDDYKKIIERDIVNPIMTHPDSDFIDFNFQNCKDLKLFDYLKSAQSKFPKSTEKSINVLAIAVHISEFNDYFGYLYNTFSGLFCNKNNELFKESNLTVDMYDKVDVVYLTSLTTGHYKTDDRYSSFELGSYFNLLCRNPFSRKIQDSKNTISYEVLQNSLPNSTVDFENFYNDFMKIVEETQHPIEQLLFPEYISKKFPELWKH
ncbi:MAG: hypothetical protein R3Y24_05635 [Eubacteriales bacterium]